MTRSRLASRRHAREAALQVLYAMDLARERRGAPGEADVEEAFQGVATHFELPEGARAFAKELVHGVTARREELDGILALHARHWRVERMAMVDRNILRLGAFELLHLDTPAAVVMDEAVNLAHRFGGQPSPAFVNGVLDAIAGEQGGKAS